MKVLHTGMPEEIATGIRRRGKQFSVEIVRETMAMYARTPRSYCPDDIHVLRDIAYGGDARQLLDVHVPKQGLARKPASVLMFVHGGGYLLGNREGRRNIPDYFAANGYIGVNVTHRLAPQHRWPAGGLDMGAAVAWVHTHIAEHGGDPGRIYLMGESAGAFHVATYVFRPELLPQDNPRVAGAILISGPFLVDTATTNAGEAAYFGDDRSRWSDIAFTGNITRTDIPVLLTVAEYDPPHIDKGVVQMIYELTMKHGVTPRFRQLTGHNHISGSLSIGTGDMMLAGEILDFIATNNQRLGADD